ncbi:4a-hydroxytetrahydrobiopterin dehydratase [Saccharopolyspora hattusasensis]|uniref:4a-hydroxytetrahydrobiopterin dehydratase n=1 Tax=Saccharopolyspora hattusasensis TaxID=1128679 RepID=UPI003D97C13E
MPELLSDSAVIGELDSLPGWTLNGTSLSRTWTLKGFNGAVQLANVVAWIANQAKHHPDVSIHDYNQVTVTTTTHDAGGVTDKDVDLARRISTTLGENA